MTSGLSATVPNPNSFGAVITLLTKPAVFFTSIRDRSGYKAPLVFALLATLTSAAIVSAFAITGLVPIPPSKLHFFIPAMVVKMIELALLGSFLGGGFIYMIAKNAGGQDVKYRQSVTIAAYAMVVIPLTSIFGVVPYLHLNYVLWLYGFYIAAIGTIILHQTRRAGTLFTFFVCGGLGIVLAIYSVRHAMQGPGAKAFQDWSKQSQSEPTK